MTLPGTDYEMKTTFWSDFSIADVFGAGAVTDTYDRAFAEWKYDPVYLTELAMTLNHKIWQHYRNNAALSNLYDTLYWKTDEYALDHLKDGDLQYYLRTMD